MSALKIVFVAILSLLFVYSDAQKPPIKWGNVDEAECAMLAHPVETDAEAMILCAFGDLAFDVTDPTYTVKFSNHYRIKLFNQTAIDRFGNQRIKYYSHDGSSDVTSVKAQVILPNGEKIGISKKDFVDEKLDDYWSEFVIPFTNLVPGAIIEYQYILKSNYVVSLVDWYFQKDIPVKHSELRMRIPKWYDYVVMNQGRLLDINDRSQTSENVSVRVGGKNATDTRSTREASHFQTVKVDVIDYRFAMVDVPSLHEESYITTMDDHYARIKFQLKSYSPPNAVMQTVMSTWPKLAKDLLDAQSFGKQLNSGKNQSFVSNEGGIERASFEKQIEYAKAVYDFINKDIEWNGYYSYTSPEGLSNMFKIKSGTSGEKNLFFLAAMKQADIEAYPVLTSTRSHGKMYEIYPFLDQFNQVIVLAVLDGNEYFVDLTEKEVPFGMVHKNGLNKRGWVIIKDDPQWVTIKAPKGGTICMTELNPQYDGTMNGRLSKRFSGYDAIQQRKRYDSKKEAYFKDNMTEIFPDLNVTNMKLKGFDQVKKSVSVETDFENAFVDSNGDLLYIDPMVFSQMKENPFKATERAYPVDIPHPISEKYITNIALPEGYMLESAPEQMSMTSEDGTVKFRYLTKLIENKFQVTTDMEIKRLYFEPLEYEDLKSTFEMIVEKMSEKVVLKKM